MFYLYGYMVLLHMGEKMWDSMISVIVITCNQEKYIRQAVESICNQEIKCPVEVLIGNDASKDGTGQILDEMAEYYDVKVIHRKSNLGASRNLYDLLLRCQGDYIAFLEGDDYWIDSKKLQKQYDFLEKNPNYIACTHECQLVDEQGIPLLRQRLEWISRERDYGLGENQGFYLAGQFATLMCRNIFKDSGNVYDIIYRAHAMISDRTLQMILALEGKLYRMNLYMSAYRQVSSENRTNATFQYFSQNIHSAYDNFMLTCLLENYAREYTGNCEIDFSWTKKMFFTSSVYQAIKQRIPDTIEDIKKILATPGVNKWEYFIFLPRGILYKMFHRK